MATRRRYCALFVENFAQKHRPRARGPGILGTCAYPPAGFFENLVYRTWGSCAYVLEERRTARMDTTQTAPSSAPRCHPTLSTDTSTPLPSCISRRRRRRHYSPPIFFRPWLPLRGRSSKLSLYLSPFNVRRPIFPSYFTVHLVPSSSSVPRVRRSGSLPPGRRNGNRGGGGGGIRLR